MTTTSILAMKQERAVLKWNLGACLKPDTAESLDISVRSASIRFRRSIYRIFLLSIVRKSITFEVFRASAAKMQFPGLRNSLALPEIFVLAHLLDCDQKKLIIFTSELNGITSFVENLTLASPLEIPFVFDLFLSNIRLS